MMTSVNRLERLHVPARGRLRQFIIRKGIRRDVVRRIYGHAFRLLLKRASRTLSEEWGGPVSTGFQVLRRCFSASVMPLYLVRLLSFEQIYPPPSYRLLVGFRSASGRLPIGFRSASGA